MQRGNAFFADRFQTQGGRGGRDRVEQLAFEQYQPRHLLAGDLLERDRADDLHVTLDVVLVARMDDQVDVLIILGIGHSLLDAA